MVMRKLVVIGGCHVVGYLVGQENGFVQHLARQMQASAVQALPHVGIKKVDTVAASLQHSRARFVVLQLGNFEFSASWKQLLQSTLGLPKFLRRSFKSETSEVAASELTGISTEASGPAAAATVTPAVALSLSDWIRVIVGGLLYVVSWLVFRKYQKQFTELNSLIEQHPRVTFVCLSPFPALATAHNRLRRLGGWLLRRRVTQTPNLHWVDTFDTLNREDLFLDGIHLNQQGHRVLAEQIISEFSTSQTKPGNVAG